MLNSAQKARIVEIKARWGSRAILWNADEITAAQYALIVDGWSNVAADKVANAPYDVSSLLAIIDDVTKEVMEHGRQR